MSDVGTYLYAVCRGLADADLGSVRGLQDRPLRVLEHRGLVAVVSDVDLDEFGDEAIREHLEDLRWLEDVARTHDEVVFAASATAPTAPLRLATICLGDDGVRARLDEWHDPLVRTLQRVAGRREWSVKAYADPAAPAAGNRELQDVTAGRGPADAGAPGAGAAYLRRRKEDSSRRERDAQEEQRIAGGVHAALSARVVASRRLALQDQRLSGHEGTMILNGAYLVDDDQASGFRDAVAALDDEHPSARFELGGPWPAYSFVSLEGT